MGWTLGAGAEQGPSRGNGKNRLNVKQRFPRAGRGGPALWGCVAWLQLGLKPHGKGEQDASLEKEQGRRFGFPRPLQHLL